MFSTELVLFALWQGKFTQQYHNDKRLGLLDFWENYNEYKADIVKRLDAVFYNPDWAIVFKEGADIKHVYFVAETKGYSDDEVLDYRNTESVKIECARRHFATISNSTVKYDVVNSYADLRNVITK